MCCRTYANAKKKMVAQVVRAAAVQYDMKEAVVRIAVSVFQ